MSDLREAPHGPSHLRLVQSDRRLPAPYYDDGTVTIYCGDCREIVPALEPVDLVLTDPPYGIAYESRASRASRWDAIAGDDSLNALRDAMPLLDRVLARDRHAYVFAGAQRLGEALGVVESWWKRKNVIVWDKGDGGAVGDLEAGYALTWEAIIYAAKGRRPLHGPRPRAIFRYDWQSSRDPVHPTPKPVPLLAWLIARSSDPGELVLDPFMGSGTTLRAARDLGRRAIGIELEERYCAAAVQRLSQETLPLGEALEPVERRPTAVPQPLAA